MARTNWEKIRDGARIEMEDFSARAETLFNKAARTRDKKKAAQLIAEAEYLARLADEAARDFYHAIAKIQERERRRERYEKEQLKKYRKRRGEVQQFELMPPKIIIQEEYEEFGDEPQVEWEFGFEYDAASGNPQNNVDVNFRVIRRDGKAFTAKEAASVMKYVREHAGNAPADYIVRGIDWRRPTAKNTRWVSTEQRGYSPKQVTEEMANVFYKVRKQPQSWRLGAPK